LGSELVDRIQQVNPDPALARKGCKLTLKRIYINDQDRINDFLASLTDDDIIAKATTKGKLTKSYAQYYSVRASLPYRIDWESFPEPPTPGWSSNSQASQQENHDDIHDEMMDTPAKETGKEPTAKDAQSKESASPQDQTAALMTPSTKVYGTGTNSSRAVTYHRLHIQIKRGDPAWKEGLETNPSYTASDLVLSSGT
jgi:hypothetical protein